MISPLATTIYLKEPAWFAHLPSQLAWRSP
jgi:hypothetical protein